MKKNRLFVTLVLTLFAVAGLFPSLSTANDAAVIAVPVELGGGYLISEEAAVQTGLAVPGSPPGADPHNLTVIITGTAGAVQSSPKGITCTHSGSVMPTACRLPFTTRGMTLHARSPIFAPIIVCAQNGGNGATECDLPSTANGKTGKDTTTAILDWTAVTAVGTADISERCRHESPTCSFNLTEDMTVTATFGGHPVAKVTPATTALKPFDFKNVKPGKTKTAVFTVKNTGVTRLTISTIDVTPQDGPFSVPATIGGKTANKCAIAPLDPGKSCTFKVVFAPTAASATPATATIAVTSDDAGSPDNVYVQGTASGSPPTGCGTYCPDIPGIACTQQCKDY